MVQSTKAPSCSQFDSVRDQLDQDQGLPFLKLLSRSLVEAACRHCNHFWRQRVYTPWITLSLFLSQILSDDHSCDDAVDRFQKYRYDQGLPSVSPETTSYCAARQRLPEKLAWELVRRTGQSIQGSAKSSWLFHGRTVKIVDGSTVTMPDTPENQAAYPHLKTQAPGLGFPIARLLVVFSLAVGTVLEAAIGPYQGKQTSELALLRLVIGQFRAGDIVLADRFFCSYWVIAALQARGVDVVVRLHQARKADFRRGRRLGREDHIVTWTKPKHVPDWMSRVEYDAMPAQITIRELRVRVKDKTKRVRGLVIVTTLVDPKIYKAAALGGLFRQRWHAELDIRSLKQTLKMDVLRCQTPEMVRKEIWAHVLVANLIRGVMAEAAREHGVLPRELSFQGARQTMQGFRSELSHARPADAEVLREVALKAIASHRVGDRPDRVEPRVRKRRPKNYPLMHKPRPKPRKRLARAA